MHFFPPKSRAARSAARLLAAAATAASCAAIAAPELGVFRGAAPSGPAETDRFGQWLGKPATVATVFSARSTWAEIEGSAYNLQPWGQWVRAQPGRNIAYHIAMFPTSGGSLASCAAGQYDAHWARLANNLAVHGLHWAYIRIGAEMDGAWFPWNAPRGSGKEASFAGCFRRVVTAMRQAQPANQWKFVLNVATAYNASRAYLESVWPGDAYVDVVGVDFYDQSWWANTYPYPSNCDSSCRLARQQTVWNLNLPSLTVARDFAIARGKTLALPEWGAGTRPDGHGGGDDPYFIRKMWEFIQDPANRVVYHGYWDYPAADFNAQLSGATRFPESASMFRQLFGQTGTAPANTAPTVSLTAPAAGQTVSGTVTYSANATDNAAVTRVEFAVDGTPLASDTTAPYGGSLDTTRLANGSRVLRATAYDAQGLSASSQVTLNVQNATGGTPAPTPTPTPAGPAVSFTGAATTLSGVLRDSPACEVTGTGIVRVVFFLDGTQLNTETWAPWQCAMDTRQFANGTHTLRAVAYNAAGASTSVSRTVTVQNGTTAPTAPANTAPTVSITAPAAGQTVSGTVSYAANAADNAGVARVDFALDGAPLASDTAAPFGGSLDTTRLANGTHVLRATAVDAQGLSTSTQVSINVQNGPAGPTGVTLTAPSTMSGAYRDSTACQVTGSGITRVLFFVNGTQVSTESWAPWQCSFDTRAFANGAYTLRAVAYNAAGGTTSVSRSVTIRN